MPAIITIKPEHPAIEVYYKTLKDAEQQQALHEGNVSKAFERLLEETAKVKGWMLVSEHSEKRTPSPSPSPSGRRSDPHPPAPSPSGRGGEKQSGADVGRGGEKQGALGAGRGGARGVRYDGVLRDQWRLPHGHWEAKDTYDDLDTEIRKKRENGYSFENILFEDTQTGVLFQSGMEVMRADLHDRKQVADLLTHFYSHEIAPFQKFSEAVAYFQHEIPGIAQGLKNRIDTAHTSNKAFQKAYDDFMELCKTALNPNISSAAVDEMLIQHMLTERIIHKVFKAEEFSRRNVIANEIEHVINSLTSQHFNRTEFLGALDRFYTAIEDAADELADFHEKQTFINLVYERFFQGYSVKIADTHGIVYTPQPIVDFMCAAVEEVLETEFGAKLGDESVWLIDPCTGTGNFIVNLLRRAYEHNPRDFDSFYRQRLFANEVMLMPYYIASLNIEHEYFQHTGRYEPFEGICFVDTLDLAEGEQMRMAFMTERNTERVERQKQAPITVIIGNPPYNAKQLSENDNNKNRTYEVIDRRVRDTYAKDSKATNKNALGDPYVKFFRWATERLQGRDGVVCFVSNNSFVDQIAFDGMRKHLLEDFHRIYLVDLKGNIRKDSMRDGIPLGENHTVFGLAAMVGISISVLVRNSKYEDHKAYYHAVNWRDTRVEKFNFLQEAKSIGGIEFEETLPDTHHNWLLSEHGLEFTSYLPMGDREIKTAKKIDGESIFKTYSRGVATARDAIAYDFSRNTLSSRIRQFIDEYNAEVDRFRRAGKVENIDDFVRYDKINWSRDLKLDLQRRNYAEFQDSKVRKSLYRPFCKNNLFFDRVLNEEVYVFPRFFPLPSTEQENLVICATGVGAEKPFAAFISNIIPDLNFYGPGSVPQWFPFYVYDEAGGSRRENITDWALGQFRERYGERNPQPPAPSPSGRRGERQDSASLKVPLPEGEGFRVRVEGDDTPEGFRVRVADDAVYRARASEALTQVAQDLRQRQTPAETILWECLRNRRLDNLKFRRQHPLANTAYVVDFLCYEANLVVELDGSIHEGQVEDDVVRQANIEAEGYRVLRFTNEQIYNDLETVLTIIAAAAHAADSPRPEGNAPTDSDSLRPEGEGPGMRVSTPEGEGQGVRVITKWDIFYYVYGLLHHPAYRERFADNLKRELPRIPFAPDFWAFAEAGKKLADLHLNYETVKPYKLDWVTKPDTRLSYRVEKMRLIDPHPPAPSPSGRRGEDDESLKVPLHEGEGFRVREYKTYNAIQVNDTLTLRDIPA